jgi:hypothetical protein
MFGKSCGGQRAEKATGTCIRRRFQTSRSTAIIAKIPRKCKSAQLGKNQAAKTITAISAGTPAVRRLVALCSAKTADVLVTVLFISGIISAEDTRVIRVRLTFIIARSGRCGTQNAIEQETHEI